MPIDPDLTRKINNNNGRDPRPVDPSLNMLKGEGYVPVDPRAIVSKGEGFLL